MKALHVLAVLRELAAHKIAIYIINPCLTFACVIICMNEHFCVSCRRNGKTFQKYMCEHLRELALMMMMMTIILFDDIPSYMVCVMV